ncbi:ATP-binding cassette domain-containing protein, partial [Francisella tularensis subsp. holarctica]|uniref:ATP-binding cassette domain-containing protein n=1 Tax=Francisella tularensis TaxID=263 RepID=UPI0023819832
MYFSRWVVYNVSMKVSTGEFVGLLGQYGGGKTNSLYMIVGLFTATRGKVRMGKEDVTKMPIHL